MRDSRAILRRAERTLAAHPRVAVLAVVLAGFCFGFWVHQQSQAAPRERTVRQLARALQARNTPLHDLWQVVWMHLPNWMTTTFSLLQPRDAADLRRDAAFELGDRGAAALPALPMLVRTLTDPEPSVRLAVVQALSHLGPTAREAEPALLACFNDPTHDSTAPTFRPAIAGALIAIGATNTSVTDALLRLANTHPNGATRERIIASFGALKHPATGLVLALAGFLHSTNFGIQQTTVEALGQIGPGAAPAVPALLETFKETLVSAPPGSVRMPTPIRIEPPLNYSIGPPPVPPTSGTQSVTWRGIPVGPLPITGTFSRSALYARYGEAPAVIAGPLLLRALIETFGKIGPASRPVLPWLSQSLTNREAPFRHAAAFARWQIEQDAAAVLPLFLRDLEQDRPVRARESAVEYLARIGPEAVPVLTTALEDEFTTVRFSAIEALGNLGTNATAALPRLRELSIHDPKYANRLSATTAVQRISPAADAVKLSSRAHE